MSVTYTVDDTLEPASEPIKTYDGFDVKKSITRLVKGIEPEAYGVNLKSVIPCYSNGFISALDYAYAQHYPLTLSPDDIWLTLSQSFAAHVDQNAEKLRHMFVSHEGKKEIVYHNDSLVMGSPDNPWMAGFDFFASEIKKSIGTRHDLLTADFSTTGLIERAASQVVLMDAMKHYFSYGVCTSCGIPQVTLLGTTDDWKSIRARVQAFTEFDGLEAWARVLDPILEEFVNASQGNVNKDFWSEIYKSRSMGSGGPQVSGWGNSFFLYLQGPKGWYPNPLALNPKSYFYPSSKEYPSGISRVQFTWNYHGVEHKYEFLGGFLGVGQAEDLGLRPAIGWAVRAETSEVPAHSLISSLDW